MLPKNRKAKFIPLLMISILADSFNLMALDGQQVLDEMSAAYRQISPCVLGFEIVQYYDSNSMDYQSSKGSFYFAGADMFRVDFIDQEIIYDGQWLWSYDKPNRQVIIEPLDPQSSLTFIFDMLKGNWANFRVVSAQTPARTGQISLGLKTRDNNAYFNAIFLDINPETHLLQNATYLDFNALKTVINFSRPKRIQPAVAEIMFDTQRLENRETIDLRP